MKFEYKMEWIPSMNAVTSTVERLNELGMNGWELMLARHDILSCGQYVLFKRAVPKTKSKRAK